MRLTKVICSFLVIASLSSVGFSQQTSYGRTSFPTSGTPEAQELFLRGLLMLHSFQYEDAREAFQEAERLDPDFAMAYWGEAMTHNHPVWFQQDREAARAALRKLGDTPEARLARAPTEREKNYLRTADILFGDGEKEGRDFKYADAMAHLAEKYPDDLDAATFHALAILGTSHQGRDFATYMKAAAIVEEVFDKNPEHPGAAHYLIHSYDDPIHAPLGLRPARIYAKIAPSASHALHMPSHIFFALGMWDLATESNINSYDAAKSRSERKRIPLSGHGYHALWWLLYSNLQQGRYADARKLLDVVEAHYHKTNNLARARHHVVRMNTAYALETGKWQDRINRLGIKISDMNTESAAAYLFLTGKMALDKGDAQTARNALDQMQQRTAENKGAAALQLELAALIRLTEGEQDDALDLLNKATAIEDAMPLDFGPPWPLKPSHELLGEVLLKLDRPAEAQHQFELALQRTPRRAFSLLGLARAAARSGDSSTANQSYRKLKEIWHAADSNLAALKEVKAALELAAKGTE
ncbi:MAG: tetratricopeptide repeat protein [bacterium]